MISELAKTHQLSRLLPLRDNAVGLWRFRSNLVDESAQSNDLTAVAIGSYISGGWTENIPTAILPTGPAGPAAKIVAGSATDFDFGTGDFTIEVILATSSGSAMTLVAKNNAGSPLAGYYLAIGTGNIAAKVGDGANDVSGGISSPTAGDGRWYYIALTVDRTNDELRLYHNGVLGLGSPYSISAVTGNISAASNDLEIGNLFDGGIDEIAIHPQVLSADEIAARAAGLLSPIVPIIPNELKQYFRGIDDSPEFDEYLIPFESPFAALRQKARDITDLVKFDQVQERHLGTLASLFNFELPDSSLLDSAGRRTMFEWITWLYQRKGTHDCVEKWLDLIGLTATTADGYPDTSIFIVNVSRLVGYPLIPLTLFTEDFEDNLSQWDPPLNPNLPWRIQNGALYCKVGSDTNYDNAILFDDSARTFYMEADIKLIDAIDELFGFYLAYQDSNNWLRLSKEPHVASSTKWVLRWSDGGTTGSAVISDDWGDDWDAYNNGDTIKLWLHVDLDRKLYSGGVDDRTFMFEGTDSHPDIVGTKKGIWQGLNAELEWDNVTVKNMRSELEATLSGQSDRTLKLFYPGTSVESQTRKAFMVAVLPRYIPFGVILEWVREVTVASRIGFRTGSITVKAGIILDTDRAARIGFRTAGITAIGGDIVRTPTASRFGLRTTIFGLLYAPTPSSRIGFRTGSVTALSEIARIEGGFNEHDPSPWTPTDMDFGNYDHLLDGNTAGTGTAGDIAKECAWGIRCHSATFIKTIKLHDNYGAEASGLYSGSHNAATISKGTPFQDDGTHWSNVIGFGSLTRTNNVITMTLNPGVTTKHIKISCDDGSLRSPDGTALAITEVELFDT